MANFFADNFADCVWLAVFLMAACPVLESKISIPFALSTAVWGSETLSPALAFCLSVLGGVLGGLVALAFGRFIKNRTSGFVCEKFLSKFEEKHKNRLKKLKQKRSVFGKCLAIATFVAIPLPLTGVWMGGLLAGISGLKFWHGFAAVCVGEVVSASIVLLSCVAFDNFSTYVLLFSLGLLAVSVAINLFAGVLRGIKKRKEIKNSAL